MPKQKQLRLAFKMDRVRPPLTREERLKLRDTKVRELFERISNKNPRWCFDEVIAEIEINIFISRRTIEAILRGEGRYAG